MHVEVHTEHLIPTPKSFSVSLSTVRYRGPVAITDDIYRHILESTRGGYSYYEGEL